MRKQSIRVFSYSICSYRMHLKNSCVVLITSKMTGFKSVVLVEGGSMVGAFQGFCLFYHSFREYFKETFDCNLTWMESLLGEGGTLLECRILINIWYCISYLLNVNSLLAIQKGFLHGWRKYFCQFMILKNIGLFSRWFLTVWF